MSKKRVLIADDDSAILEVVQLILEDAGYTAVTAVSGEAIYKMEKDFPDLILLDIWMSGTDGRDICTYVKKNERTRNIPIIMVSANKNTKKIAREVGADDFLTKPFEIDELLEKVKKCLS
jgi:CheY-like chemotaxis protein